MKRTKAIIKKLLNGKWPIYIPPVEITRAESDAMVDRLIKKSAEE